MTIWYMTILSNEETKTSENSSHELDDQLQNVTNLCDVGMMKTLSTSCDDPLGMHCSSHIDACSSSMFAEKPCRGKQRAQNSSEGFEPQLRAVLQQQSHQ